MIKKIIILLLTVISVKIFSAQNIIEIANCNVNQISETDFILNYSVNNTFGAESYSKLSIMIPFEKYLIQNIVDNGIIKEKDFLFAQTNVDLNGDNDIEDTFVLKQKNRKLAIENVTLSELTKKTSNYNVYLPYKENGSLNLNRISKNGIPFTLKRNNPVIPLITIGLTPDAEIEFRKLQNNAIVIEIVPSGQVKKDEIMIDGSKPFTGKTNEKEITGGETLTRYVTAKNISSEKTVFTDEVKIKNITKPFSIRITYYFNIGDNLILTDQKIITVN